MKQLLALASAVGDRVNPVAVKEFRQAVQSRWVTAVFMLFLLLNLSIVGGYLMLAPNAESSQNAGREIFLVLETILFFTCAGFVPLYTGIRLSLERNDTNIDLFFVTTITPGTIVRGKYLTAMSLTLLIFSSCMPFMILTYLLRGIDLPTIFFILAISYLVCAAVNALGVFAGSVSGSWFMRGLVAFGVLITLFYVSVGFIELLHFDFRFGRGGFSRDVTWAGIGTFLLMEGLAIGLLYVLSVALLSPKPANRMLVPRLYITGTWAVAGVVSALWGYFESDADLMIPWLIVSGVFFMVLTVAALGERDAWTARVRRFIPRNRLLRLVAFLFYTGSAGGIIWWTILFWLTMLATTLWNEFLGSARGSSDIAEICGNLTIVFGYILCYCLTTAVLRMVLLRTVNTFTLSVIAAFIGVAVCLVPYLIAFFVQTRWLDSVVWYLIGSPMVLAMDNQAASQAAVPFVIAWLAVVVLAGGAPWAIGQWRRFTPYETKTEIDEIAGG